MLLLSYDLFALENSEHSSVFKLCHAQHSEMVVIVSYEI